MASFSCVHHIEVGAVNGDRAVDILRSRFMFMVKAVRQTDVANQWLLVKNKARFLITSLKIFDAAAVQKDSYVTNWMLPEHFTRHPTHSSKDSVFNVAFQVKDIDVCSQNLRAQGVPFTKPLQSVKDDDGTVWTCVVKSCIGDVHHTLLDKKDYSGFFLPGFLPVSDDDCCDTNFDIAADSMLESFDHVAIAVEMNTSMAVINWYEKCFGMKRFLINRDEDENQGLVLSTVDVGLRLRAIEYWKCAEVGLIGPEEGDGVTSNKLSMVIAEGMPPFPGSEEESQIESWIRQHGGPGIQHAALTSNNIKSTVINLRQAGAPFANPPPPEYYSEIGRLGDIIWAGEDAVALRNNGILIDTEADGIHDTDEVNDNNRKGSYLLQIFTRPVFPSDPFFLEIIQRKGASGFGSGNVAALYRSVQAYITGQKKT